MKRALTLTENSPVILGDVGAAHARAKHRPEAEAVLRQLAALSAQQYVPSSASAVIHAALGDNARALEWLEKAYDEHDFAITQIRTTPWLQSLSGEPRFQQLITRLGLGR